MPYQITSLGLVPFSDVYECFVTAFADYAVNVAQVPESALLRRAGKNGWAPELSFGAWSENCLVGITLIGVDAVAGERRAYDIATGIAPGHRGQGLAGRLMDFIIPELNAAKVPAFDLEVLQDNQAGIRAYEKAGFSKVRALHSLVAETDMVPLSTSPFEIVHIGADEICRLSPELGFEPSFEQRDAAIRFLESDLLMFGACDSGTCVGAIAYDTATQWLMRVVTHRSYRRKGVASALLSSLAGALPAGSIIKAVNVDERDAATLAVLEKCGFRDSIRQWEMRLRLAD